MKPEYWGNGTWFLIFITVFRLYNSLEKLKRVVYVICSSLPCKECRSHALENLELNNIMSSEHSYRILIFFIHLRNAFQKYQSRTNTIIPIDLIIEELKNNDNELTQRIKILILSKFYYVFNNNPMYNEEQKEKMEIINELFKSTS